MDGNTHTPITGLRPYLAAYLPAIVILLAGLAVTALTANVMGRYASEQTTMLFQVHHRALVHALADFRGLDPHSQAFSSRFTGQIPERISVRIDTLQTHSKTPVFESSSGHQPKPDSTLRSEISLGGKTWLVSSTPDRSWFQERSNKLTRPVWASGLTISVLAALSCALVAMRWRHQQRRIRAAQQQQQVQDRELNNAHTEKRILRQALNDSEQRSRDLVSLSGGIVCELDESGQAGYVSDQIADMLGYAPADLAGVKIDSLVAEPNQQGFEQALEAARQDRQLQRLDLTLIAANQAAMPATLRVLALHDTLHGFSGYRLILQARH